MNAIKWLISGFIGGLVGAIIWALIFHYANFELGIIAWGVGVLAGVGVRVTAGDNEGLAPGSIAVIAAVLALCIGKVGGLYLDLTGDLGPEYRAEEREFLTTYIADGIVIERYNERAAVDWPRGSSLASAETASEYPKDIWSEAKQRYSAFSESEIERFRKDPSLLAPQEFIISYIADAVIKEWDEQGRSVKWPEHVEPYTGMWSGDYPSDAWSEAVSRWDAMTSSERTEFRHRIHPLPQDPGLLLAFELVKYTFTFWDVIWFGLALVSAYKIGSNEHDE